MPRRIKPRKIGFVPNHKEFYPKGKKCDKHISLKLEELEAIRLKDLENLHQKDCANIMEVSRQTFQLILESARKKIAKALINGESIKIEGGNYVKVPCSNCLNCEYRNTTCHKKCYL